MEYMPPWGTKKSPCPSSALVSPHMGRDGSGNSSQLSPLSQPYCPTPTMPLSPNSTAYGYNTSTPYYTTSMNIAPVGLPSLKSSTSLTRFGDYYLISSVQGENDIFRAMKRSTGSRVLLYRVHTACLDHAVVERVAKTWRWIRHPNIIPLQNMVLTSALSHTSSSSVNSPSGLEVIAEYRYIPKLKSFEKILQSSKGSSSSPPPFNSNSAPTSDPPNAFVNSNTPLVSESNVWSIAVQLLSAVQHVHACHAVVRGINSQSVCLGPWGRVYITKIGIMDLQLFLSSGTALNTGAPSENSIKNFTSSTDVNALQKRDLADVGQLLLTICCAQQSTTSLEIFLSLAYYTQALKNFVLALIPNPRDLDEVHDLESLCRRRTVSSSPTTTTIQHIGSNSTETKICTSESDPGIKDTNEPSSWLNNMQVKSNLTLGHEKLAHELDGLTTEEHANRNTSSFLRNYDRKVFVKAEHALQVLMNRILDELAAATNHLNNVVINEEHNIHGGRALRVLTKLNFILDRQDQEKDSRWNETNPRYLLRLFRSYVFHQIDSQGVPSLDWGHVMTCLHKLDIGSEERILLMSKDEHILTVTSYLTLRETLDEVFNELLQGSASKSVSFPWYKG